MIHENLVLDLCVVPASGVFCCGAVCRWIKETFCTHCVSCWTTRLSCLMLNPPMDCPNRYVSFNNFSDSTTTNGIIGGAIRVAYAPIYDSHNTLRLVQVSYTLLRCAPQRMDSLLVLRSWEHSLPLFSSTTSAHKLDSGKLPMHIQLYVRSSSSHSLAFLDGLYVLGWAVMQYHLTQYKLLVCFLSLHLVGSTNCLGHGGEYNLILLPLK